MKKWHFTLGAGVLLLVSLLALWVKQQTIRNEQPLSKIPRPTTYNLISVPSNGQPMLPTKLVTIGKTAILAELATTAKQKSVGLSNRAGLEDGAGMLFIFDEPLQEGFWMKDMHFSLDIIWADHEGTIVTIYPNLSPQSYPNVYRPTKPASYVLEVPAGFTAREGIVVGDKIVL